MLYTSYFAKLPELLQSDITPVAISISVPDGVRILRYKKLAPTWSILSQYKTDPDWSLYTYRYNSEILSKVTPDEVRRDLARITEDAENIAMLCYEKGNCHRHLVAEWLRDNGVPCIEWVRQ